VLPVEQTGDAVPHEHAPQVHAEVHVCEPFTSHVCVLLGEQTPSPVHEPH